MLSTKLQGSANGVFAGRDFHGQIKTQENVVRVLLVELDMNEGVETSQDDRGSLGVSIGLVLIGSSI